jgi:hypothetical protein
MLYVVRACSQSECLLAVRLKSKKEKNLVAFPLEMSRTTRKVVHNLSILAL